MKTSPWRVNTSGGPFENPVETKLGFRYLQFGSNSPKTVTIVLREHKALKVRVRFDSYRGRVISEIPFELGESEKTEPYN